MYIYICSLNGMYRSFSPAGHGEIWVTDLGVFQYLWTPLNTFTSIYIFEFFF